MMRLSDRLEVLRKHGWQCIDPTKALAVRCNQMQTRQCVWCEGLLCGVPRACYLDCISGRVLLIGELRDVDWDEFVRMLETGIDPDDAPAAATKPVVPAQRSLF